jgi:hypothetical protein
VGKSPCILHKIDGMLMTSELRLALQKFFYPQPHNLSEQRGRSLLGEKSTFAEARGTTLLPDGITLHHRWEGDNLLLFVIRNMGFYNYYFVYTFSREGSRLMLANYISNATPGEESQAKKQRLQQWADKYFRWVETQYPGLDKNPAA